MTWQALAVRPRIGKRKVCGVATEALLAKIIGDAFRGYRRESLCKSNRMLLQVCTAQGNAESIRFVRSTAKLS